MKKLDKKDIRDILALTPMQEGMLYHYLKNPGSQHYFEQLSLEISGEINLGFFEKAWDFVVNTNEVLRTVFRWEKLERATQVVLRKHRCKLEIHDLSNKNGSGKESTLIEIKRKERRNGFDLREVPFRVILGKVAKQEYCLIISYHHILYDGWSCGIILREFFEAYHLLCRGGQELKPRVKPAFKEFIRWIGNRHKEKEREFWKTYFYGFDTPIPLPGKRRRRISGELSPAGNTRGFSLGKYLTHQLETFLKKMRSTTAVFFYCAWGILLRKYCNAEEVVFGTTVSGRHAPIEGIEKMVGLFINTLPLRMVAHWNDKVEDLLNRVKMELNERKEYESSALVDIKEYSGFSVNSELFDTVVVMENYPLDNLLRQPMGPLSFDSYSMFEMTHYDLTICIIPGDEIRFNICCSNDLLGKEAIIRLTHHLTGVIEDIIHNPHGRISSIEIISPQEKKRLLVDFNRTAPGYPLETSIYQLFAGQVDRTPDHVALIGQISNSKSQIPNTCAVMHLTYRELDDKVNQLAYVLREKGTAADGIVGIMVERSVEMVILILSILKAGGAYLPIDPDYPGERIRYILADSRAKVLVTLRPTNTVTEEVRKFRSLEAEKNLEVIFIDSFEFSFSSSQLLNFSSSHSGNLSYVIYTSGSTGKPKGVMVEQSSVVKLIFALQRAYPLNESDVYLLKTSYIFDVSVAELFGWYPGGGGLAILERGAEKDPKAIIDSIKRWRVTHINFVPSMFNAFVQMLNPGDIGKLSYLRYIFLAGEALLPGLVEQFKRLNPDIRLENIYGPTEATVYASWYSLAGWDGETVVPIGKPLPQVMLLILDGWGGLQPIGIPGELCIGGDRLARGYLNRPELTAEKFDRDFWDYQDYQDGYHRFYRSYKSYILYKTGDLARWLSDGNIEFLGRMDHQVKIRGFRIELGEIENQLSRHDKIKEAAVVVYEGRGSADKYLCAYVVLESWLSGDESWISSLKEYLSHHLPVYMIPTYFISLDCLPSTPGGKLNRRALPEPEVSMAGEYEYAAPRDQLEEKLAEIWFDVLGIGSERISLAANFFELGGHSLKQIGLVAKIHKLLNVKIPIADVYKMPTIRAQAAYINGLVKTSCMSIEPAEKKEFYALALPQKRFYIFQQLNPKNTSYNLRMGLVLAGSLDRQKLEETFRRMIYRHESLRTSFEYINGEPVQVVHDNVEFGVFYEENPPVETRKSFVLTPRAFDLSRAPLLRVGIMKNEDQKHLLMIDIHHIVTDGISSVILSREFMSFYGGETLPTLRLQYKDYSQYQNRRQEQEKIEKQGEFWINQFTDGVPLLDFPTDYPRPTSKEFGGNSMDFRISTDQVKTLKELAVREDVSVYMILLAVYNILLFKLSGQEDIVVGIGVSGRSHADLMNIMGLMFNTIPLRNFPCGEMVFLEFLNQVKTVTFKAFENQEYPFDRLVEELLRRGVYVRDVSRSPLFDTMFAMQNFSDIPSLVPEVEIAGLKMSPYEFEYQTARFDLFFMGFETGDSIRMKVEYDVSLFKSSTIERINRSYMEILEQILENTGLLLKDINISSSRRLVEVGPEKEGSEDMGFGF
jgi:tyrocidine synthetase-3